MATHRILLTVLGLLTLASRALGSELQAGVYEHILNKMSYSSSQPYFDTSARRNVSSVVGQTSHLHCTVRDLGDRTVSWIRKSDLHVLTSNVVTFTGDERFSCLHETLSDHWTLQIKYTQMRDKGEYQCQVNTEPKISMPVHLMVQEARAAIQGKERDVIAKKNSPLELRCLVNTGQGVHESMAVFWYLNDIVLDWTGQTGPGRGARVTEKRGEVFESVLEIDKARLIHSGKFTCGPTLGQADTVTVHVIDGEVDPEQSKQSNSASMMTRFSASMMTTFSLIQIIVIFASLNLPSSL